MAKSQWNFQQVAKNVMDLQRDLPQVLANQAQKFFGDSWSKQGWDDGGVKAWAIPKRRISGTPEYKYPMKKKLGRRTRATLVQSGRLRRAVKQSIRMVSFAKTELIVDVPYADVHNSGDKSHPKRQFMGDSKTLRTLQIKKIEQAIDKVFK